MAGIRDIVDGRSDRYSVRPSKLHVKEGWNSRDMDDPDNIAHVEELAKSIAAVGVKQPLTVYMEDGKLYIEDGFTRHAAALLAIQKHGAPKDLQVPIITSDKDASPADRLLSQIIRNSGKQLKPLEMATVFAKLREAGLSDSEISRQTNTSRTWIEKITTLLTMPKKVLDYVRKGTLSATLAIEIMRTHDDDPKATLAAVEEVVKAAKDAGKDRATAKHVKKDQPEADEKPKTEKKVDPPSAGEKPEVEMPSDDDDFDEDSDEPDTDQGEGEFDEDEGRIDTLAELREIVRDAIVSDDPPPGHTVLAIKSAAYRRLLDLLAFNDEGTSPEFDPEDQEETAESDQDESELI